MPAGGRGGGRRSIDRALGWLGQSNGRCVRKGHVKTLENELTKPAGGGVIWMCVCTCQHSEHAKAGIPVEAARRGRASAFSVCWR